MLSKTTLATLALAGIGALLVAWRVPDALYRLVLWGLWIWLLFELTEAVLQWDRHPWRVRGVSILRFVLNRALIGLIVLMAFALALLGSLGIYSSLGNETGQANLAFGILAIGLAAATVLLVLVNLPPRTGDPGPRADRRGGSIRD